MKHLIAPILAILLAIPATRPALAEVKNPAFKSVVERAITGFLQPGYERLAQEADLMEARLGELCEAPGAAPLDDARRQFAALVDAFSRIELIRFGPVSENNRFERLLFWPDRKSIGARQLRRLLKSPQAARIDVPALQQKSVALQGIGPLEMLLFSDGSQALSGSSKEGATRCHLAHTIAGALEDVTAKLDKAWKDPKGFVHTMRNPGKDNPVYRSVSEAVQDLLTSSASELETVRDGKLLPVLGKSIDMVRARKAPFYRSGLTFKVLLANVESAHRLFVVAGFMDALPENEQWVSGSLRIQINQGLTVFRSMKTSLGIAAADGDLREKLKVAAIGINGAKKAIGDFYAERTGLSVGFNSRDGD